MKLMALKQPIEVRINHKLYKIDGPFSVITIKNAYEQDFKTDLIRNIPPIPINTQLRIFNIFQNFYGEFFEVTYDGLIYSIDPNDCEFVSMLNINELLTEENQYRIKQHLLNKYKSFNFFYDTPNEYANSLWKEFCELPDTEKKRILNDALLY